MAYRENAKDPEARIPFFLTIGRAIAAVFNTLLPIVFVLLLIVSFLSSGLLADKCFDWGFKAFGAASIVAMIFFMILTGLFSARYFIEWVRSRSHED